MDYLKIDKSFIDRIMEIDTEDAITKDIISMAHRLGHKVVAEGIEFEKQKKYLPDSDCDKIQGYLIAKPLNVLDAKNILKKINGV